MKRLVFAVSAILAGTLFLLNIPALASDDGGFCQGVNPKAGICDHSDD